VQPQFVDRQVSDVNATGVIYKMTQQDFD